jgi:hypothetical protein
MTITVEKETIPWPKLEPKIQALYGVLYLTIRVGVAPGIEIQETQFKLPVDRVDPNRANEFLEAIRKIVNEFNDEIPF